MPARCRSISTCFPIPRGLRRCAYAIKKEKRKDFRTDTLYAP